MTKKDREIIRGIVQEELTAALCRKITIERGARQQGDPEKVVREEEWNVLDFMAAYAPKIEAALRGMQEDVDHAKNKVFEQSDKVDAIGIALLGLENSVRTIAKLADALQLNPGLEHKLLGKGHESQRP